MKLYCGQSAEDGAPEASASNDFVLQIVIVAPNLVEPHS